MDEDLGEREAERLGPGPPPPSGGRTRRLISRAAIDVSPLRKYRDFRLLFFGQGVTFLGSMLTYVAIPFQAYDLTGSTLVVGAVSAAELVPLLAMAFVGGALADAMDRRRMIRVTEAAFMVATAALLANSLLGEPRVWVLFVVSAAMAAVDGLQRPSLNAIVPRLVERDDLTAAAALSSLRFNIGLVAGPPLAGLLIATAGLPATYAIDLLTFGVSLTLLARMRAVPPLADAPPPSLRGVLEGIRFATSRQVLMGTYLVDIVAMFFGIPMALFPAMADDLGGPAVLGLLYAAPSVGSLVATVSSGWAPHVHRHGWAIIIAASGWGVAVTAFGLAPALWIALIALAVAGACDMISGIFRQTVWDQTIPDELRGRLAGIEMVSFTSGPLLGNLESGVVAALAGVRASIVSGGIFCVVGVAVTALALPVFRRYDSRDAQREREAVAAG